MKNTTANPTIEQIPQTPIITPTENGKKYFRQRDTTRLYFFFWSIAGTYALYKNSKTLWNLSTAKLFLRWGLLYSLLLAILLITVDSIPEWLFPFLHAVWWYFYYEYNQKNSIAYEIPKGSSYYSRWKSFWVGILSILVFFAIFIIWALIAWVFNPQDIESSINTWNVNVEWINILNQSWTLSGTN